MAAIVHGGGLTAAVLRYGGRAEDWLDLSTGINPNMPELPEIPVSVWNRLPDRGLVDAARRVARDWYLAGEPGRTEGGAPDDDFAGILPLPVPGTQSLIQILPQLAPPGQPVAIVSPTYGEYAHCFTKAGFAIDRVSSLDGIGPHHGMAVVVNPNNPDGRSYTPDELLAVHARLTGHLHIDEAFGDCRPQLTLAREAATLPRLTVSRSFGKFFGMAGMRLGFVFSRPNILDMMEAELGPWAVSGPALYLARALMSRDPRAIQARIDERKAGLDRVLADAGLPVRGGTELFSLVESQNAAALFEHLAQCHILVRKFDYRPDWLRIGLSPDEEGDRRLAGVLASFQA